jgi:hypothetical protein
MLRSGSILRTCNADRPKPRRAAGSLRRFAVLTAALVMAFLWCGAVNASCGNYLFRHGKSVTDASFSFSLNDHNEKYAAGQTPAGMPVPPCHGPNCSGNPIPLAPVPVAPGNLIPGFDQATILESHADSTSPSGTIEIPESERGARFVPSSIFRPPAA